MPYSAWRDCVSVSCCGVRARVVTDRFEARRPCRERPTGRPPNARGATGRWRPPAAPPALPLPPSCQLGCLPGRRPPPATPTSLVDSEPSPSSPGRACSLAGSFAFPGDFEAVLEPPHSRASILEAANTNLAREGTRAVGRRPRRNTLFVAPTQSTFRRISKRAKKEFNVWDGLRRVGAASAASAAWRGRQYVRGLVHHPQHRRPVHSKPTPPHRAAVLQ